MQQRALSWYINLHLAFLITLNSLCFNKRCYFTLVLIIIIYSIVVEHFSHWEFSSVISRYRFKWMGTNWKIRVTTRNSGRALNTIQKSFLVTLRFFINLVLVSSASWLSLGSSYTTLGLLLALMLLLVMVPAAVSNSFRKQRWLMLYN